jgi:hypothetical protein
VNAIGPRWRWLGQPRFWIALGLLVRVVHVLSLGNNYYFGDTVEYEQVALRMLHGVPPSGLNPRAPGYPLLLAFSFWIGGEQNFLVARLVQLLLSLVHMGLVVRMARRLGGAPAAAMAAPVVALAPTLVFVAGLLYPTLLYSTVLMALTVLAWEIADRPTLVRGLQFGALVACGLLIDMVIVAPVLGIGAWLLVAGRRHGTRLALALAAAVVATVALAAPYFVLQRSEGRDRVFMAKAQAVLYFARSDADLSRDRWIRVPPDEPFVPLKPKAFIAREFDLFRARPAAFLHDYVLELLHFFKPLVDRVQSKNRFNALPILILGAAWFVALLSLSVVGLLAGTGPRRGRLLLATVVMSTAVFYSFFFTQARYRIPVEPQLVALAALGMTSAFPRFSRSLAEAGAEPVPSHAS